MISFFFLMIRRPPRSTPFPTRRSSDLPRPAGTVARREARDQRAPARRHPRRVPADDHAGRDRKSTRLNSSHMSISYAVFCLKKKTDGDRLGRVKRVDTCVADADGTYTV